MNTAREAAYRIDPALWMREVLGITPHDWQEKFLRAPRGASIAVLTARQVGKTTAAAVGNGAFCHVHAGIAVGGCLSRASQSAEALRKVRDMVLKAGAELITDNVYGLELANGSRVLALPGSEESIRGLTVDAWIVADEAARWIPILSPPCVRCGPSVREARFAMLSTAWSRTDPFWSAWENDDPSWMRIQVRPSTWSQLDRPRGLGQSDDATR